MWREWIGGVLYYAKFQPCVCTVARAVQKMPQATVLTKFTLGSLTYPLSQSGPNVACE